MNAFVKLRQKISPYLFLVPCLIVFGLFLFYPFAKTIYLSLYKTDKLGQAKLFVGFGNYIDLFTSESFYNSLLVTPDFCGDRGNGQHAARSCDGAAGE